MKRMLIGLLCLVGCIAVLGSTIWVDGQAVPQPQIDTIETTVINIDADRHNPFRFCGKTADQSGNNWGEDNLTPYQAISGLGVYGADANDEAKVIGTDDTPILTGSISYDVHSIQIADTSLNTEFKMRIIWGTGTMAAAITADQFSELMFKFDATNPQQSAAIPVRINMPSVAVGTFKIWAQVKNATDNATCDFFVGMTEF